MRPSDQVHELSVGGPHGIRLRSVNQPAYDRPAAGPRLPLRLTGMNQSWLAAHGRLIVGGLAGVGVAVMASWAAVVAGLSLPWQLYLPGLFVSVALWIAAGLLHAFVQNSRRALAAQIEREILHLASRAAAPLTVPDTARALGLSLHDAESALSAIARAGHMTADVDLDTGDLLFRLSTRLPQERLP
jgi:hypothetical protein